MRPDIDEPIPPGVGRCTLPHTEAWAQLSAGFGGDVIVTPDYNHAFPGRLKNAGSTRWRTARPWFD